MQGLAVLIVRVFLEPECQHYVEVPVSGETTAADVLDLVRPAGIVQSDADHLVELWRGCERPLQANEKLFELLAQWGMHRAEVKFYFQSQQHIPPSLQPTPHSGDRRRHGDHRRHQHRRPRSPPPPPRRRSPPPYPGRSRDERVIELQQLAARQQQQLNAQQQALIAREQRLQTLRQQEYQHAQRMNNENSRVRQLREDVDQQELRLRQLRALRAQTLQQNQKNDVLGSELDAVKALFSAKEKELAAAVSRVEALTAQLNRLQTPASAENSGRTQATVELQKLRQELLYRTQLNAQQNSALTAHRQLLRARQGEMEAVDRRIHELTQRLRRKRNSKSTQRSSPQKAFSQQIITNKTTIRPAEPKQPVPQPPIPQHSHPQASSYTPNMPLPVATSTESPLISDSHVKPRQLQASTISVTKQRNPQPQSVPVVKQNKVAAVEPYRQNSTENVVPVATLDKANVQSENSDSSKPSVAKLRNNYEPEDKKQAKKEPTYSGHSVVKKLPVTAPRLSHRNTEKPGSSPVNETEPSAPLLQSRGQKEAYEAMQEMLDQASAISVSLPNTNISNKHEVNSTKKESPKVNSPISTAITSTKQSSPTGGTKHDESPPVKPPSIAVETSKGIKSGHQDHQSSSVRIDNVKTTVSPAIGPDSGNVYSRSIPRGPVASTYSISPNIASPTEPSSKKLYESYHSVDKTSDLPSVDRSQGTKDTNEDDGEETESRSVPEANRSGELPATVDLDLSVDPALDNALEEILGIDDDCSRNSLTDSLEQLSDSDGSEPYVKIFAIPDTSARSILSKKTEARKEKRSLTFNPLALLLDGSLEGELELVKSIISKVGNPSEPNDEGITALHNAICAGHMSVVRYLVEYGCDVNAPDIDGWTPLHCAASCNSLEMVQFLIENGACIFATTISDNETAVDKCDEEDDGFDGCSQYLYGIQEKLGVLNQGVVYCLYDYEAQNSDELCMSRGDQLTIVRKGDERYWWFARALNDKTGYVPRNYLALHHPVPQRQKAS